MFLFLVALEGQITRCDIRSSTLKCCITLMEEAFWGQHYWDWAREVASEMEQSASVCVRAHMWSVFKNESRALLNDR